MRVIFWRQILSLSKEIREAELMIISKYIIQFFYALISMWLMLGSLSAQPVYNMQNALVTDCEGVLLDSDAGPEMGQYNHNEEFTFTICVEAASEIIVNFEFFASEDNYDILTIYDGPDRNAPVLATLSGLLQPAPTLVATSGCITFHFVSDDNIVAIGWRATWRAEVTAPVTPMLSLVSDIECPMNEGHFRFDRPVPCDLLVPGNFSVLGPGGSQVTSVIPIDCDPATNTAENFMVTFTPPLGNPVNYRLLFNGDIEDACGTLHPVSSNVLFTLANCPLSAYIQLTGDAACMGDCADIEVIVDGGASGTSYGYSWSHTTIDQQSVEVCADDTIAISVTVTDLTSMQTVMATYEYIPLPGPMILNPIQDTVCASNGDHFYNVTPGGGSFYSDVIPDNQRTTGRYQFWRWANEDPFNTDIVTYVGPNGCETRDTVYILPINAGSIQAACVGSDPFTVNGGSPGGGEWSGMHIDVAGEFNPTEEGSFIVTYTAPNGCSANKRINVTSNIEMPDVDSLCTNQAINLEAEPYGGRWSGPGIMNGINGRLEAWRANFNQWNTYTYELNGCVQTMEIYINEIWAGPDRAVCASETMVPMHAPGDWSGPGIYLQDENAFDISGLSPGTHVFTLRQNGCTARFELYIIDVQISADETPTFCAHEGPVSIHDLISRTPGDGVISGPGISYINDQWHFNPTQAGEGMHMIYFEALGCVDSMEVFVEPYADIQELSFCELKSALTIQVTPPGGVWSGPGFLDESIGLFDPQSLDVGLFNIEYTAPSGCRTTAEVDIFIYEQVSIQGFEQQYCYNDTSYILDIQPAGGIFTINGMEVVPEINPTALGPGTHELLYRRGVDECASSDRRFISVLEPIQAIAQLENDSICMGQATVVAIEAMGGLGNLSYNWSGGLGFGNSQIARPEQSTWYTVTVTDQCSDPLVDSLQVWVYEPFDAPVRPGPTVCYEDSTFAEILLDEDEFNIEWQTNPVSNSNRLDARPGVYTVDIEEVASGCSQSFSVQLPGAAPIRANFTLIPNQDCIDIINNEIEILELSVGYSEGWIDFGDGSPPFDLNTSGTIRHAYRDTGDFTIQMYIENELGCADSLSLPLCVENRVRLFVPTAFTPNGDGTNDDLEIFGIGINDVQWRVYDRFGSMLFDGQSLDDRWNGSHRGRDLNPGTYIVVVTYTDQITNKTEVYKGEVQLIK